MGRVKNAIILLFLLCATIYSQSAVSDLIPECWIIEKTIVLSPEKVSEFGDKLGGEIIGLTNDIIETDQGIIQINMITCKTEDDSKSVYSNLLELHKSDLKLLRLGKKAFEFKCSNIDLVKKAKLLIATNHPSS